MIHIRYAILSDIHSNLEALSAVLAAIDRLNVHRMICLGDIVGYNANPGQCIDLLRERGVLAIRGNHDSAVVAPGDLAQFGRTARRAIQWTRQQLDRERLDYLAELPVFRLIDDRFVVVHAALHPQPNDTSRIHTAQQAQETFNALLAQFPPVRLCFFGHTHLPVAYAFRQGVATSVAKPFVPIHEDALYLINPGTVGRPLDGLMGATFVLLDTVTQTVEFRRVDYDRAATLRKTDAAGLIDRPSLFVRSKDWLWERLEPHRGRWRAGRAVKPEKTTV